VQNPVTTRHYPAQVFETAAFSQVTGHGFQNTTRHYPALRLSIIGHFRPPLVSK
jgi:hypothetical protein